MASRLLADQTGGEKAIPIAVHQAVIGLQINTRPETKYDAPAAAAPGGAATPAGQARADAVGAELVSELLERWPLLTSQARCQLALQLLARHGLNTDALSGADEATLHSQLERLVASSAARAT